MPPQTPMIIIRRVVLGSISPMTSPLPAWPLCLLLEETLQVLPLMDMDAIVRNKEALPKCLLGLANSEPAIPTDQLRHPALEWAWDLAWVLLPAMLRNEDLVQIPTARELPVLGRAIGVSHPLVAPTVVPMPVPLPLAVHHEVQTLALHLTAWIPV